jgi:hypothetical protein
MPRRRRNWLAELEQGVRNGNQTAVWELYLHVHELRLALGSVGEKVTRSRKSHDEDPNEYESKFKYRKSNKRVHRLLVDR